MKEIVFFSHDANAMNDTKILNMRADYGIEGYGLYWVIIEQLRCEENYKMPLNKNTYRALKVFTGTNIDIEKYIMDCINEYNLFQEEDGMFFSMSLIRRMDLMKEKKIKRSVAGKKGAEKRWESENMSTDNSNAIKENSNAIKNDGNAIKNDSKKWQKKRKEIKIKEKKENILTKLNKTFILIINNKYKELEIEEPFLAEFNHQIDRLDFKVSPDGIEIIPPEHLTEFKVIYLGLFNLYFNGYRVYFNKLSRDKIISKLEKTAKYLKKRLSDENLVDYVAYFVKCLQDDFEMRC